uniref:Uncharacterized protein n=1 Tax=virus sp. ctmTa7 TaxID=2828255 RepID=A0A8S5RCB6_9VIRU|nr:MAG TPA: hypothetical protein [virus sp. ctmTa7]
MKPLIYFDFEECSDKDSVIIKKCRLEEILDEVYQAGCEDGMRGYPISKYTYTTTNNKLKINSDALGKRSDIEFTCNG